MPARPSGFSSPAAGYEALAKVVARPSGRRRICLRQAAPRRENEAVGEDKANRPNGATEPETASGPAGEGETATPRGPAEPVLPPAPQAPEADLAPPPAVPKEDLPPPPEVGVEDLSPAPQVPSEASLAPPPRVPEEDPSEAPSVPTEDPSSVPEVPGREPSSSPEAAREVPSSPAVSPGSTEASEGRIGEDEIGGPRRPVPEDAGPAGREGQTSLEEVRKLLSASAAQGGLVAFLASGAGLAMPGGGLLMLLLRRRSDSRAKQTIRLLIEHGRLGLDGDG